MSDQQHIKIVKRSHFLTEEERNCLNILQHSIDHSMYILPKVQVEDLFKKPDDQSDETFWLKFKRISQKHFDFLICNRKDFKPLLIVHIRGENHHENISREDEEFLKNILDHAHIPLLDISFAEINQYKQDFEQYVMNVRIKEALGLE